MISGIRDYKNYKTPNAQICFELENSGNHVMFYLSMSSLTVAQTNIYQKRNLFVFCCHGEKENVVKTLSYTIYAIVESFYQNSKDTKNNIKRRY